MAERKPFYGWYLVGITFLCYGFGITPAYISWGYFSPEIIAELGFTREQTGTIFGLFTFLYSGVGPIVGYLQNRIGIRAIMTIGSLLAAFGMFMTARSTALWEFYLYYAICGGAGIGLSTIIPAQTLGQNWFLKRRALAIAIIFFSGSVVGFFWPRDVNPALLESGGWRFAFDIIGGVSMAVAILCAIFIRDTPESIGQTRDGLPDPLASVDPAVAKKAGNADIWTAGEAMRTPQFGLLILCGIAYALPWGVVAAHGRLHLNDLGYTAALAGALIGTMFLVSGVGRLSGALGDWINPRYVLAGALVLEAIGTGGLIWAENIWVARALFTLIGLGFGAAYISVPVVFADFFGRRAFGTTAGVRILVTGIFNAAAPALSGAAYTRLGSYSIPFVVLLILGLIGAVSALLCRKPVHPSERG